MLNQAIYDLVSYGVERGICREEDRIYTVNRLLEALGSEEYTEPEGRKDTELDEILSKLLQLAVESKLINDNITERDLFDTKLMGCLTPPPSEVIRTFREKYAESPKTATDWYYDFSCATDYIRTGRVKKDLKWTVDTEYGALDITINLSKPEKDPKAIAAARAAKQAGYPKCLLCKENEGYAGRLNSPARQNHRIIPVTINDSAWMLQYSPYVYYNEHCIVFNGQHTPMAINRATFRKLLDFVKQFPHYFVGSNAALPIVGGSILSHDHFQGGRYEFPMARAKTEIPLSFEGFNDIETGIVRWPMSVIRLRSADDARLVDLADKILTSWRGYTDEDAFIFSETDGVAHNTITPIARFRDGKYELDLVLRNNITTEEHPLGVFHPHAKLHHIKKENIGLIEVMGLAVLPARLKAEMAELERIILAGEAPEDNEMTAKHAEWARERIIRQKAGSAEELKSITEREIGYVFKEVLSDAGVYKCTKEGREAFLRFLTTVGGR